MADTAGVVYTGELDCNGKYTGYGRLEMPVQGSTYEGMFMDGQFHGEGKLIYNEGGGDQLEYTAYWERGVEVKKSGTFSFSDGLVFNPTQDLEEGQEVPRTEDGVRKIGLEWGYLSASVPGGHDRRFWQEHLAGGKAAVSPATSPAKMQHGSTLEEEDSKEQGSLAAGARQQSKG